MRNRKLPDFAFRMACKTASGTNLGDARYTDAPGYFFDVSGGKNIALDDDNKNLMRIHAMAGFYSWQMNLPNNPQNDAFLYGAGIDVLLGLWYLENALDGYIGYFGDDEVIVGNPEQPVPFYDRPFLYRAKAGRIINSWDLSICFQAGLNDFFYSTYTLSLGYFFDPL